MPNLEGNLFKCYRYTCALEMNTIPCRSLLCLFCSYVGISFMKENSEGFKIKVFNQLPMSILCTMAGPFFCLACYVNANLMRFYSLWIQTIYCSKSVHSTAMYMCSIHVIIHCRGTRSLNN